MAHQPNNIFASTQVVSLVEVRWRHAMRLLPPGAATLREGRVPVRMEAHRDRSLGVKRGDVSWIEVDAWRLELHREFERALGETNLPERPDYEAANRQSPFLSSFENGVGWHLAPSFLPPAAKIHHPRIQVH